MNKLSEVVVVVCGNCGKRYEVKTRTSTLTRFNQILDFAICPICGTPRNKILNDKHKDEERCKVCNIPKSYSVRFIKGLCEADRIRAWREENKNKDLNEEERSEPQERQT